MTLAELARQEGVLAKPRSGALDWLRDHPELCQEVSEMRDQGFTFPDLTRLLRKHYGFSFSEDQLRRALARI